MIGYSLALLIGFTLGLLGGGGSILTVPILVYVLKMDPKLSIALSLAIVGITSMFGVIGHHRNKNVEIKIGLIFGAIAMIGTFTGAKLSVFITGQIQLLIFAIIMIMASIFMFKGRQEIASEEKKINYYLLIPQSFGVGIVTGIVGVGGGFLIVPALIALTGISMQKAVGTSLFIICINSLIGFTGYLGIVEVPWKFLALFSSLSIAGVFAGSYSAQFVNQKLLKKIFAIFLIVMGAFILYKNSL